MRVRLADRGDAPDVARIYNRAVLTTVGTFDTEQRSVEDQERYLAGSDPRCPTVVAEEDGRILGWASLSRWSSRRGYDGTAEISVYVDPNHHGRGLGQRLGGEVLAYGRNAGLHTVLARIEATNRISTHVFEKLGFAEIGTIRQVGHKFDRYLDVTIMQLLFHQS